MVNDEHQAKVTVNKQIWLAMPLVFECNLARRGAQVSWDAAGAV
jgi:hypothetical protein